MNPSPPAYQQLLATLFLLVLWVIFGFLAIKTLQTIQNTPPWAKAIFPNQIMSNEQVVRVNTVRSSSQNLPNSSVTQSNTSIQSGQIATQNRSTSQVTTSSQLTTVTQSNTSIQSGQIATQNRSTSQVTTSSQLTNTFTPPQCRDSGVSQFNYIGQRGYLNSPPVPLRIEISSPVSEYGIRFEAGTAFEIIGISRCGTPRGYSASMLFLNVRLLGLNGNYTGWIPESGYNRSGRVVYNVTPVN